MVPALLLAASACGGAAAAQPDPAGQQAGTPPACRAADLHGLFRGFRAAGGSLTAAVVLTSAGSTPCQLGGTPPSVTLLDQGGGSVAVKSHAVAVPQDAAAVVLTPGAAMPVFGAAPGAGTAWFVVTWSNWCSDTLPTVSSLLVVLPAGGSVVAQPDASAPSWAAGRSVPKCDDARAGSTLTIGRFQAPGGQTPVS